MKKSSSIDKEILDSVAGLTSDIKDVPNGADVKRLRFLMALALRLQRQKDLFTPKRVRPIKRLLPIEYDNDVRETLRAHLLEAESSYFETEQVLEFIRRDVRESLLEGRLVDRLSGLSPGERLGPFVVDGGTEVWFDVFFAARRLMIIETGSSVPALVLTKARPPKTQNGSTTIDVEPGTVWLRGDLIDSNIPAGAFVGVKVSGGYVELTGPVSVNDDTVKVGSPLCGELSLELTTDEVKPAENGFTSSGANIDLPDSLRLRFGPDPIRVDGATGKAQVWRQSFEFPKSQGSWFFVQALWTLILEYTFEPQKLDTGLIQSDLIDFKGKSQITKAGLGLPVVIPIDSAILGEVANAPSWWLTIEQFTGHWYEPDPRYHTFDDALVRISSRGTVIYAECVLPISPPVTHAYMLWSAAGSDDQRIPWHQTYEQCFMLSHSCDVVLGEHLVVRGHSTVALDRPIQVNGITIETPTNQGILLLHKLGKQIIAMLGAAVLQDGTVQQLALRNALIWTSQPVAVFVQGELDQPQLINTGSAQLIFGVHEWAPILPDPYVSNFDIRRPDIGQDSSARSQLVAKISWISPNNIGISFQGQFGPPHIAGKGASPGEPKPAPVPLGSPYVGPTQVGQNQLHHDKETSAQWDKARSEEAENRDKRVKFAMDVNEKSQRIIDGYLTEVLGTTPPITLLDVSTNQDLLGVAFGSRVHGLVPRPGFSTLSPGIFSVSNLEVYSQIANIQLVMLPQVQWEPVRTLDSDQDIDIYGWFPTPLASATDGGATQLGARSQRLVPYIPEEALHGTYDAYAEGTPVVFRTTLPFGLVTVVQLQPNDNNTRPADLYQLTQPKFPAEDCVGGLQITAQAEGGRPDLGGISPEFIGHTRQLINGVDLRTGTPLGLSVLGSTGDPNSNVELIFNNDMTAEPRVPVTRFDLSGYGGSNFSDWNNPFAAFAQAAKVQFHVVVGRTILEVIKVNSVLHPWGIRVTRSITVERRPGGGVIRRDSGWQAFTPGLFDYRYIDKDTNDIEVADYTFDAGIFKGLFNVRSIRPAPGNSFSYDDTTMIPYYFDAELALEGLSERTHAIGVLGYLQTLPIGKPASKDALRKLIETQGSIGGPIDVWLDFGGSGLPFRAHRIEIGLALDGSDPIFVATVRGVPTLPKTGAWSVVTRPVATVPPSGGEAVSVPESQGVPLIRRYPIRYFSSDKTVFTEPPLDGLPSVIGDYRFADAADLLVPSAPAHEYALLQSTPIHAFLFPRPYVRSSDPSRIHSDVKASLADVISRSTSKGAFPPSQNTIELAAGSLHFNVGSGGTLALSSPISIVSYPTPLRIAGSDGHGSTLFYNDATLTLELQADRWIAEFTGLRIWSDILGLQRLTGSELRIVGSTNQRPQIAELKTLIHEDIEEILSYIPLFGARGVQGPIDLGASNAKHEIMVEIKKGVTIPKISESFPLGEYGKLELYIKQSTGYDRKKGMTKASAAFGAKLELKPPLFEGGVVKVFAVITLQVDFSINFLSGIHESEKLDLLAFVGIGAKGQIGPFSASAYLGIGFLMSYDVTNDVIGFGGLVALEADVNLLIVGVKIRAELKGLVSNQAGSTICNYNGKVKIEVEIFLFFSISATYQISDKKTLSGGSP